MRIVAVLLSGFLTALAAGAPAPEALAKVRTVYLFPMSSAFDQYLANRLTNAGVFQVVTDPQKADAVLSDRLGVEFADRLAELFPEPPPEPDPDKPAETGEKKEPQAGAALVMVPQTADRPVSTFGRGKGTLFLVDPRNRAVIWSTYERNENPTPENLDRAAGRVTNRLKRELTRK